MTTNLFVIAMVKQLRTDGSFRILLPFFRTSGGVGVLNSAIFKSFHSQVEFGTILEGFRNFGEGGLNPPQTPPRYATGKRPLVRPRREFEDNIKMDLNDLSWEGQDWIDLAQTRKSSGLL